MGGQEINPKMNRYDVKPHRGRPLLLVTSRVEEPKEEIHSVGTGQTSGYGLLLKSI